MIYRQFSVYRGDTWPGFVLAVNAVDPINDPVDFTDVVASSDIRETADGALIVIPDIVTVSDATTATVTVSLSKTKSAMLQGSVVSDVQLLLADGRVFTAMRYQLNSTADPTRGGAGAISPPLYHGGFPAATGPVGPIAASLATLPVPVIPVPEPTEGGGDVIHADTLLRDAADSHPTAAITGLDATLSSLTAHTSNTSNPHATTAAQVGADPTGSAAAVNATLTTHTGTTAIHVPGGGTDGQTLTKVAGTPAWATPSGGGGPVVHADTTLRSAADSHPTTAITGLDALLTSKASVSSLTSHTSNTSNPHSVTAAQAGADPTGSAAAVQTNLTTHTGSTAIHVPAVGTAGQVLTVVTGAPAWAASVILESPTVKRIKVDTAGTDSDTLYVSTT